MRQNKPPLTLLNALLLAPLTALATAETNNLDCGRNTRHDALQKAYDTWSNTLPEPLWNVTPDNPKPAKQAPRKQSAHPPQEAP